MATPACSSLNHSFFAALLLVLIAVVDPNTLLGQVGTGGIAGSVKDSSGAFLPDVEITIRNEATSVTRTTVSNDVGLYRVLNLIPGRYSVTFELDGFKTLQSDGNVVSVALTLTLDARLQLGEVTELVTVTSLATAVNTEDSQPSNLVAADQITELPLNGRVITQLALLSPGTTDVLGTVNQSGNPRQPTFASSGTRYRGNSFLLDGSNNTNDDSSGFSVVDASVDAVREFRLIRNNFSAEYGRHSGSVVSVVTKSGTNVLHGSVFYFNRNSAFDAADTFAPYNPNTGEKDYTPLNQHQFGFTAGGPIIKDKLFLFGGYEGYRYQGGGTVLGTVETSEFREYASQRFLNTVGTGVLRSFPAIEPTRDIQTVQDLRNTGNSCIFCDLSTWPIDLPVNGTAVTSVKNRENFDQFHLRVDWRMTDSSELMGRLDLTQHDTPLPEALRPGVGQADDTLRQNLTLSFVHSFTPVLINELRFTDLRFRWDRSVALPDIPATGLGGGPARAGSISVSRDAPWLLSQPTFQLQNIVSFSHKDHFIRTGFDFRRVAQDGDYLMGRPSIIYQGLFDYVADAPFRAGMGIDPTTGALTGSPREFRSFEVGWFVQDDWKASTRLTLNLGLRWDYFDPLTEATGRLSNVQFPLGESYFERIRYAVIGEVGEMYSPDLNNFAPRLGFALDLFGDGRTALRGGYGLSYEKVFLSFETDARLNPPYFAQWQLDYFAGDDLSAVPLRGPEPGDITGGYAGIVIGPPLQLDEYGGIAGKRIKIDTVDPNLRDSYVHSLFLGLQHELTRDMVLEVNGQATYGKKLAFQGHPNRFKGDLLGWPNPVGEHEGDLRSNHVHPSFGDFFYRQNRVTSNYHGLNLMLNRRMRDGLSFQASYTLGKSLDYNSDVWGGGSNGGGYAGGINFLDLENIRLDYGRSNFDIRHRFVTNFIWQVPYRQDRRSVLGQILGGWQMTGIYQVQSGPPFKVWNYATYPGGDYNADTSLFDRPNAPSFGNSFESAPDTKDFIAGVFERTDFPKPEPGTNGNLGRNTYTGPNFWSVDMGLSKNFRIPWGEETRLQFRAEFFNLFNRVNLKIPNTILFDPLFGKSTSQFPPRQIQFALKLMF